MYKNKILICALITLLVVLSSCTQQNNSQEQSKVKIGYIELTLAHTPIHILHNKGILTNHGVDYELMAFPNGGAASTALGAGEIDVAFMGLAIIPPIVHGVDAKILATNGNGGTQLVCMTPGIHSLEDLKGKKVGVHGVTSSDAIVLSLAMDEANLPVSEINIVEVKRPFQVLALTEKKSIDCLEATEPIASEVQKKGAYLAISYKDIYNIGDYPLTYLVATNNFIKNNPEVLKKIVSAHVEGTNVIKNDKESVYQIMADYFNNNGIQKTVDEIKVELSSNVFDAPVSQSVTENLVSVMQKSGLVDTNVPFNDLVDCSFGQCVN